MPTFERDDDAPLTLTHARLRVAQGDLAAARRILAAILAVEPRNPEAAALLTAIRGPAVERPKVAAATDAGRAKLEGWLESIQRQRGARRDAR